MKNIRFLWLILLAPYLSFAQSVSITPSTITANSTTKPIVIPRMTAVAILNIPNPMKGTLIYDLTNNVLRSFNGTNWVRYKAIGTDITPNTAPSARKENESGTTPPPQTSPKQ